MTNAARILGIFPLGLKSHFNYNYAIMRSLHATGHHVTMITPFIRSEEKIENFTFVDAGHEEPVLVGQYTIHEVSTKTMTQTLDRLIPLCMQYCDEVMKLPLVQVGFEYSIYLSK